MKKQLQAIVMVLSLVNPVIRYFVGKRNVHSARNCQLGPVASGVTAL